MLAKEGNQSKIPRIATEVVTYLKSHCIEEEGLFRLSGNLTELLALKKDIDSGKEPSPHLNQVHVFMPVIIHDMSDV